MAFDKYSVGTDEEQVKVAEQGRGRACPGCGSTKVDFSSNVPHCPNCGTTPWEAHASRKEDPRARRP